MNGRDNLNISVGYYSPPQNEIFPGYEHGGVRIVIGGRVLTRYTSRSGGFARYDAHGNPIENTDGYVGEYLDTNLDNLTDSIVRFQHEDFDRYNELSAPMVEEPGDSTVVLSFCDGEHARIAFQPMEYGHSEEFPTEVTVGYAIDPDEMCRELIDCYEDCVTYFENAFGDKPDFQDAVEEVHDWADEHIQDLLAATSEDE